MKKHRFKSKAHLSWVHELGCTINNKDCRSPLQAHHLLKPWVGGRGMSMKADDRNVIPLCLFHHMELHTKYGNEDKFFDHYSDNPDYGRTLAEALYNESVNLGNIK